MSRFQQADEKPWGKRSLLFVSEKFPRLLCCWLWGSVRPHLLGQGTGLVGCESPPRSGDVCGAGRPLLGRALSGAAPLPCSNVLGRVKVVWFHFHQ